MNMFKQLREICATEIQRLWRGVRVRSNMGTRSNSGIVICWDYGREEDFIRVAGSFSGWHPWIMNWCKVSKDHRVFVPRKLLDPETEIDFKFIVNGEWTCDGAHPMREDAQGNINNFVSYPIEFSTALGSDTPTLPTPTLSNQSPFRGMGVVEIDSSPPMLMKLRKQLTSSGTPTDDGVVARPLGKFNPPPRRKYSNPHSLT